MADSAAVPVIAGLAVGLCFVVLFSIWSAFSSLNASDFAKRANSNGVVRSFLQIFPDAYVSVQDSSNSSQVRAVLYAVSMPWSQETEYDVPVPIYLRAVFSETGYPIMFHVYCQTEDEMEVRRIWLSTHARLVFERSEVCQKALDQISK
jgi:hypothetical protein